jgi:hypothetical protein
MAGDSTTPPRPTVRLRTPARDTETFFAAAVDLEGLRRLSDDNTLPGWPAVEQTADAEVSVKYLCLIYDEEKKWATMAKSEADAMMGEYFAFTEGVKKSGHYIGGEALQPTQTATTVRVRQGKVSTTDGPFAETKEQLGGYYLIEARDLNDAIQVAAKIPSARIGAVEVRPIMVFG